MNATFTKQADTDEDPVTLMLQKTGCLDKHYKVQVSDKNTRRMAMKSSLNPYFHFRSALLRLVTGDSVKIS
jgi:hypothetical protein